MKKEDIETFFKILKAEMKKIGVIQMSKIYFFNGWGMDKNILKPVKNSTEYDIEVINFPYDVDKSSIDKDDIFIGYSFGVYYLNKFLSENKDLKYKKAIGINGLPQTIGKFGINEKMFNITLDLSLIHI